ncbi:HU family DNA-binding protein [Octadecabacter antarcticus]|nr:HU family DNA-binding protein [Octadecabacter antarcticus]
MATRSTKTKTTSKSTATAQTPTTKSTATTKGTATAKADVAPVVATSVGRAPVGGMPNAVVVETVKTVVADAPIKKPEFIDRVMAETGLKKKDVKPVVEAMLAVLGRALIAGEELIVPPLGKVMINRSKQVANATIINIKLRHPNGNRVKNNAPDADPIVETLE